MSNAILPIAAFRNEIINAIQMNPVTILTAETGAGKSTQVAQYLLEEGCNLVTTQPRRLAARTVAARVAEEYKTSLGEIVGFRTAYERMDSDATRCLFVTDGLALVRELMGRGPQVLVIDEVHEWNLNIEVLVAWAKHQMKRGVDFKVVLMSATLEAQRLSDYFGGTPVINVSGRTFPVEELAPSGSKLEDDVVKLLRQGRNVLVFQPGKREIEETVGYLQGLSDLNAEIFPLHGGLTPDEQKKCFRSYGRPKCIVATNVAQTSITIPDIDAVVDGGMERRQELRDGVEGLYLGPISFADREQRKGRAGRTKPGVYIDWCPIDESERLEFPEAEILRVRLDQTVLRLAATGIDMEELEFFHQPDLAEIRDAKRALVALGCMDSTGKVTPVGKRVAELPISVKYGRMVVEAEKLGVVDDILDIAAILEQGGITAKVCSRCKSYHMRECDCWRKLAGDEKSSDAIAQLRVYQACEGMKKNQLQDAGVHAKNYFQARDKRKHLAGALKGKVATFESNGNREHILKAVCAGMVDHLYEVRYGQLYRNGDVRGLTRESVVSATEWVVGEPWDLEIPGRNGTRRILLLVRFASAVNPAWLSEIAPHLVETRGGTNPCYDHDLDEVVSTTEIWFNGQQIETKRIPHPTHPEANRLRREGRNLQQWHNWDRPEIGLPNLADDDSTIPDVARFVYGTDVGDGTPLVAYAVVAHNEARYLSSHSWFNVIWTLDADEADRLRCRAMTELPNVRHQQRRAEEQERQLALRELGRPVWECAYRLRMDHYYELTEQLREQLRSAIPDTSSRKEMDAWIGRMEATIASAEAFLKKSEAERTKLLGEIEQLSAKATSLLGDHYGELSADLEDELIAIEDRDGVGHGDSVEQLQGWITRVQAKIDEVEKMVSQDDVGVDALAMLRGHFNSR